MGVRRCAHPRERDGTDVISYLATHEASDLNQVCPIALIMGHGDLRRLRCCKLMKEEFGTSLDDSFSEMLFYAVKFD